MKCRSERGLWLASKPGFLYYSRMKIAWVQDGLKTPDYTPEATEDPPCDPITCFA